MDQLCKWSTLRRRLNGKKPQSLKNVYRGFSYSIAKPAQPSLIGSSSLNNQISFIGSTGKIVEAAKTFHLHKLHNSS